MKEQQKKSTENYVSEFKNRLNIIDKKLIGEKNNIKILNDYHTLKKEIYEADILSKGNEYDILLKKIKIIDDYIFYKTSINQKNNLDFLTIVNTICLPIGIIVGYFGMNFSGMGNPHIKKGILSINEPHLFVAKLSLASSGILVALLIYFLYF